MSNLFPRHEDEGPEDPALRAYAVSVGILIKETLLYLIPRLTMANCRVVLQVARLVGDEEKALRLGRLAWMKAFVEGDEIVAEVTEEKCCIPECIEIMNEEDPDKALEIVRAVKTKEAYNGVEREFVTQTFFMIHPQHATVDMIPDIEPHTWSFFWAYAYGYLTLAHHGKPDVSEKVSTILRALPVMSRTAALFRRLAQAANERN